MTDEWPKSDMKNVEAILCMPKPTKVEAVRRLQGMITYLAKTLPRLSTTMEPIRQLTRQDCHWELGEEQETGMSQLKKLHNCTFIGALWSSYEMYHPVCCLEHWCKKGSLSRTPVARSRTRKRFYTDHKPLETIVKKPLHKPPKEIPRRAPSITLLRHRSHL